MKYCGSPSRTFQMNHHSHQRDMRRSSLRPISLQSWIGIILVVMVSIMTGSLARQPNSKLHLAVYNQTEDELKTLIQNGADVNGKESEWGTPLMTASIGNDTDASLRIIKYLLDNKADAFDKDATGQTFLHKLLSARQTPLTPRQLDDLTSYLVSRNLARLFGTAGGNEKVTPLMLALKSMEVETGTLMNLYSNGENFNGLDKKGDSALKYAVSGKWDTKLFSDLIALGANWKLVNKFKFTLLHHAAYYYHVEGIKFFVNKGLNINAVEVDGVTPLHQVCADGKDEILHIVRFMIKKGANTTIENKFGRSPLHDAKVNKHLTEPEREKLVQLLEGKSN